jgi:tRNA(Ile)-lysidine synthase
VVGGAREACGGGGPRAPPPPASVLAVESLLERYGSGERALSGGWRACKEYDRLFVEHGPRRQVAAPGPVPLPIPGEARWGDHVISAERVERYAAPEVSAEAYVDAAGLKGPLLVRAPIPGDRLRPLGAPGTRKLQDVLVDRRVPARERARWPLVVCGGRIVWVCGVAVAEEGRITRETTGIVRFGLSPDRGTDRPGGPGGSREECPT